MNSVFYFLLLFSVLFACSQPNSSNPLRRPIEELPVVSWEEVGFNQDSIETLIGLIETTDHPDFRGMVVIKDNQLVIEEYFTTYWRNTVHDIRSAGKSVTAILLGIAIKDGLVENLDQDIHSFLKEKYPNINPDYQQIRLRDLLNMASGLDADTDDPGTTGRAPNWIALDNWRDYTLQIPLTEAPGKRWVYADINPVLIGAVIEEATGMSLRDYAVEKLFKPLNIEQVYWYTNVSNQTGAAGNLYLTTLDFAKIGLLVCDEGRWNGRQLVDPDYIKEIMTSEVFDLRDNNPYADYYGLLWYKSHRSFGDKTIDYLFASGSGGNHLIVIPKMNMVIALTSSAYGPYHGHGRSFAIMSKIFMALE